MAVTGSLTEAASEVRACGAETVHAPRFTETGCEETRGLEANRKPLNIVEDSSIERQADHLNELARRAKKGDRDLLMIVETISRLDRVSFAEIVSRGPLWLAERLKQGLPFGDDKDNLREIPDSDACARRVYYALNRIRRRYPDDPDLPEINLAAMSLKTKKTDVERFSEAAGPLTTKRKRGGQPIEADLSAYAEAGNADDTWELSRRPYFRALNDQLQGDQQPLRKLWKIAEFERVNISRLDLTSENLSRLLWKHRLHDNPDRYASQILICLRRLLAKHPGLLCKPVEPSTKTRIQAVPHDELPAQLAFDITEWLQMTPVKIDGKPNLANALRARTIGNYTDSTRTLLAALELAGVRLDPSVGIAFLAKRSAVSLWLRELDERCKPSTVCGHLAALLRIAIDLPGQSQADIDFLVSRLSKRIAPHALDADRLARLAKWTEPEMHACLLAVPDTLMREAEDMSRTTSQRILAGGAAFAFQLMWEVPALEEPAIAGFDFANHIEGDPGARVVLRQQPASGNQPATLLREPVSADLERLLDRLIATRRQMLVANTLLLPGTDGLPRETRAAMEVIYNKIQGVLSERFVRTDFRDLNSSLVMENPDTDLEEAAAALGYAQARSLERRFAAQIPSTSLSARSG